MSKTIKKLNDAALENMQTTTWHDEYNKSSYIFVANLNYAMNEGDIAIVFSQYGEIVDVHLVRDKITGKSKGFCFLAYEDQRSTILAVDNFNHAEICGRLLRVDHVREFKPPKEYLDISPDDPEIFNKLYKPSGPDGKGWGIFRELTQEELVLKAQIEAQSQEIQKRNEKIFENMQQIKNMQTIIDEDERWDKMLMVQDEKKELLEKIEALQYFNNKMQKYKEIQEPEKQETNEERLLRLQKKQNKKFEKKNSEEKGKERKIKKEKKEKKNKKNKDKKEKKDKKSKNHKRDQSQQSDKSDSGNQK
ncbi:unnamed protein product [Paramecium primaurelia]|uniref:RRM domain-containing protein n=1 Tax=Paramecium primaurelia TaxID=5886 RepID=A0A8S1NLQ8_PARPR|nr:unnamed protein product [Paramecium primaurelia]